MSLMYTYATGSVTESKRYSTLSELITQIPDNTGNLIQAGDVRDSVFTLWERISEVSNVANSAASASVYFQNVNSTTIDVGGIPIGSSFSTPKTMQEMFDLLLYPYVGPDLSFNSISAREFGANTSLNLNWSVVKKSNTIQTINVDNSIVVATGNDQTGVKSTVGTHSVSPISYFQTNTFTMSVYDGSATTTDTVDLNWRTRSYWGSVDLSSLGNPDLTTYPLDVSLVSSYITSNIIKGLTGAGVGSGSELVLSKNKTYNSMNGSGRYLIFAWASNLPNSYTPMFNVNGLNNTAFTRVKTNWSFTNQFGFTGLNYEVWISNTLQNSPLNIIIS